MCALLGGLAELIALMFLNNFLPITHATKREGGGGGEASLALFENQKKCPDFGEKNALVVSILWLNMPFKM